jgi:AcrR family transcriptional regulator
MPTVTWARVDPVRRAAIVAAAEAEFAAHGFSRGSLNVIARRAGVAKGSLFQYFADKRDLYSFIADVASQRVRAYMEGRIRELDASRPFSSSSPTFLTTGSPTSPIIPENVRCMLQRVSRSTPMPASVCGPSSTVTTWKFCGRWCVMRTHAVTSGRIPIPTHYCHCC